jgi:hypothetical protein
MTGERGELVKHGQTALSKLLVLILKAGKLRGICFGWTAGAKQRPLLSVVVYALISF